MLYTTLNHHTATRKELIASLKEAKEAGLTFQRLNASTKDLSNALNALQAEQMALKVVKFIKTHKEEIERDVKPLSSFTFDEMFKLYLEWQAELDRRLLADLDTTTDFVISEIA